MTTESPRPTPHTRIVSTVVVPIVVVTIAVVIASACSDRRSTVELSPAGRVGQEWFVNAGCAGCHGSDGGGGVGPSLVGIRGTERQLADGRIVVADQDYLVRAIMDPHAELVDGYSLRMPVNQLTREQVDDIITYLDELSAASEGSDQP